MIRAMLLFIGCLCLSTSLGYFTMSAFMSSADAGFAVLALVGVVSLVIYDAGNG